MTSIKLDENCDIVFDDNGMCELVEGNNDITQAIRVEMEQNKGQWVLNTNYGIGWLNKENTGLMQVKTNIERLTNEVAIVARKHGAELVDINELDDKKQFYIKIDGVEEVFSI